ncbi:hypothetical protein PUN28_011885 [Cardiocondyla obscurior]|uniref:NADH dehydrogenase subunit 6 n=1 Tax=Cardiocondyla obscurior TaxID=286306 RepID=A0AAW2FLH9_9HYME
MVLSVLCKTLYGPSYLGCSAPVGTSRRRNTWLVDPRSFATKVCLCPCLRTVGRSRCMFFFNSVTNLSVASLYLLASSSRNCPGSRSPFPYVSSAGVASRFSLYAVLTPIRMTGNTSTQSVVSWHLMAAFNCLCSLSTMPFAAGWYAVVLMCFMPVILAISYSRLRVLVHFALLTCYTTLCPSLAVLLHVWPYVSLCDKPHTLLGRRSLLSLRPLTMRLL